MVVTIKQSTTRIPSTQRFDYWRESVFGAVDMTLHTERGAFWCERVLSATPRSTTILTSGSAFTVERHRRHVTKDGLEFAAIATLLDGRARQDQAGHDAEVKPGDIVLSDLGQPFTTTTYEQYREARLYVRRELFEARVGRIDLLAGYRFDKGSPLVDMLSGYLTTYIERVPDMSAEDAEVGLDGVLHLMAGVVRSIAPPLGEVDMQVGVQSISALADAYIRSHLSEPGLDVARVVRALGISRTRLYAAFTERGGVNAAIRDARLDEAKARLGDRSDLRTIEQIARSCAFFDYPSFSRAFQRRFGLSPRDCREARRAVT